MDNVIVEAADNEDDNTVRETNNTDDDKESSLDDHKSPVVEQENPMNDGTPLQTNGGKNSLPSQSQTQQQQHQAHKDDEGPSALPRDLSSPASNNNSNISSHSSTNDKEQKSISPTHSEDKNDTGGPMKDEHDKASTKYNSKENALSYSSSASTTLQPKKQYEPKTTPLRSMPSLMDNDDDDDDTDESDGDNDENTTDHSGIDADILLGNNPQHRNLAKDTNAAAESIPPAITENEEHYLEKGENSNTVTPAGAARTTTLVSSSCDKRRKLSQGFFTPIGTNEELDFILETSLSSPTTTSLATTTTTTIKPPTTSTTNNTTTTTNHTPSSVRKWEDFVKRGTRLKTFLDDAMNKVANGFVNATPNKLSSSSAKERETIAPTSPSKRPLSAINGEDGDDEDDNRSERNLHPQIRYSNIENNTIDKHASDIARQATAEVMILKQKLKEAEAEAAAMAATNATLREAASASSERLDRTVEALRIAGTNAANARAEADASEAQAASLALQLQSLKGVVDETKRASQTLYEEHEQVSAAARSVEADLLQRESENNRMRKDQKRMVEEQKALIEQQHVLEKEREKLTNHLTKYADELSRMQKVIEEREAIELARTDRSYRIEKELREARTMLVEATAATADTESTTSLLNDTIQELQRENKSLHEKIQHIQSSARDQRETQNKALQRAEGEAQKLRIKVASNEEEIQRLRLDRTDGEKQISQLKSRINTLERRLKDASMIEGSGIVGADLENATMESVEANSSVSSSNVGRKSAGFSIPPLRATTRTTFTTTHNSTSTSLSFGGEKENVPGNNKKTTVGKCCICYKDAVGLMKSCQCGKKSCDKRAHAMCLGNLNKAGPSVSHPGTPAPRLPVVLCSNLH